MANPTDNERFQGLKTIFPMRFSVRPAPALNLLVLLELGDGVTAILYQKSSAVQLVLKNKGTSPPWF
jgi:hypothetical protein